MIVQYMELILLFKIMKRHMMVVGFTSSQVNLNWESSTVSTTSETVAAPPSMAGFYANFISNSYIEGNETTTGSNGGGIYTYLTGFLF